MVKPRITFTFASFQGMNDSEKRAGKKINK